MSRSIDQRIVEMKFDNKQFEGGIKESMASLKQLENALDNNISSKSLDDISRAASQVDLSGIARGVDALNERFSVLGIAGITVIQNITNALINGLGKGIASVTNSIVSGGIKRAMNIENAHFQLQGLISDEQKVQQIMAEASESVDGTAYSYDAAAKAASMFAASGIEAGEDMKNALKGIAGVAATTNSDYEGVSRIFTTVAGQGRLMGDQLLQLSSRGMNAAAALKNFFNGVNNGSIQASKGVEQAIKSITGATNAIQGSAEDVKKALEDQYKAAAKQYEEEYYLQKKSLDKSYKELQNALNNEYNLKKKTFDNEYKALQNSLEAEIKAQQKANSERLKAADKAYREDVDNYRKATNEKIALIDKEYAESLKIIDREAYEKTKAIDDEIKSIEDQEEAEEKAKKKAAQDKKLAELQRAVDDANEVESRKKAEEALLEYKEQLAEEELAESRKLRIKNLQEEKKAIQDEASEKKEAAKESRDASVNSIKEESDATLNAMAEKHEAEREALQEELQNQINNMQEAKNERLAALKESQNAELETLKNSQNNQLETYKENQEAQLKALKEANNKKLEEMKDAMNEQSKAVSSFATDAEITEADIREMVSKGLISFDIFSEAMATTFGKHAKDANQTFVGSLANIGAALARTGAMFVAPLIEQGGAFVRLFNAIRVKINDFNKALGASNGVAKEFTDWVKKIVNKVAIFIENLQIANVKISKYADGTKVVFESATQSMRKLGKDAEEVVNGKFYTPFHALQDVIRTLANLFKGLVSVIKPVAEALRDVFFTTQNADSFYKFIEKVRDLSKNFKLTDEQSEKLKTGFTGLFRIVESIIGVFARLLGVTYENTMMSGSFVDIILSLIEHAGNLMIKLADWIDQSTTLNTVIEKVGAAFKFMIDLITGDKVELWNKFIGHLESLTGIDFSGIGEKISSAASALADFVVKGFTGGLSFNISDIVESAKNFVDSFIDKIEELFQINSPSKKMEEEAGYVVEGFIKGIYDKADSIKQSAIAFISSFAEGLSTQTNSINQSTGALNPFIDWLQNSFWPALTGNAGGIVSLIGSAGLIYVLVQLGKAFATIAEALGKLFGTTGNLMNSASSALNSLKDIAAAYTKDLRADAFKKTAIGVAAGLLAITGALFVLSKIDPTRIAAATFALSITAYTFTTIVEKLAGVFQETKTVENALTKAAEGFKKGFKKLGEAVKIKAIGSAIKDFAMAVTIIIVDIAAIMFLYHNYETEFNNAIAVIGKIAAAVAIGIAIMSTLGQMFEKGMTAFAKVAAGVLALSVAILICIKAVKDIIELDYKPGKDQAKLELLQQLFIGVMALAAVIGLASRIAGGGGLKTGPILAMCALILVSVSALKKIFDMTLPRDWESKVGILQGIFIGLGVLMVLIGAAGKLAGGAIKAAGTILAVCAFIVVVTGALVVLELFPAEKLRSAAISLGLILMTLALVLVAAAKLVDANAGATILGMAALVAAIVAALSFLSFISWQKLIAPTASLGVVLFMLALVFNSVSKITNPSMWKVVAAMVAVLAGVIVGLKVLSSVESWETLIAAAVAMGVVLLAISKCFKDLNSSQTPSIDHICEFIIGVLAVAAIAQILRMLSDLSWETLLASAGAIAGVLLAIAKSFSIINGVNEIGTDKMMAFIVGALVTMVIGLVLKLCANIPWENILSAAGAISSVLLAMAIAFAIMNNVKFDIDSAGMVLAGCLAIGAIGMALAATATQNWQDLLGAGVSISIVLLAMAITMGILGLVGKLGEAAFIGIAALDTFIITLGGILIGLGKLADADVLKDGAEKLGMIGKALGDFVGNIIEGIGAGVGRALEAIGTSLSNFMINAEPFFSGLNKMDDSKVKGAATLAGLVLALSAAEFLNGINSILGVFTGDKDMSAFGDKLVSFGDAVRRFDEATVGVNAMHLKTVAEGASYLIDFADKIPNSGGWLGKIMGENDIDEFGKKLAAFGPSLAAFDASTRLITNSANWKSIADGTLALIDMAVKIPNSGGWLGKIMGENDIDTFAIKLSQFASHMISFDDSIMNIKNASNWKSIADGTLALVDMAVKIPNSGGLISAITGDNDIAEFGVKLNTYAYWLRSFSIYVKDVSESKLNEIARSTNNLINMCKNLSGVDQDKVANFGKTLESMAKNGLTAFTDTFIKETERAIAVVKDCITKISNVANTNVSLTTAFSTLASKSVSAYATGISNNSSRAISTVNTLLANLIKAVENREGDYRKAGASHAEAYIKAIEAIYDKARRIGKEFSEKFVDGIESTISQYKNAAEEMGRTFIHGFEQRGEQDGRNAANHIVGEIIEIFDRFYDDFEQIGRNIAYGIGYGLDDEIEYIGDVARSIAREVRDAIRDELEIESPSKAMREDGRYTGEGFALGILDKIHSVKQASLEMAKTPIEAMNNILDDIPDIDPTITPIVDLTNVMDAADTIDHMFSNALSNVGVNVGKASSSMNRNKQSNNSQNIQNGDDSGSTNVTFIQNNNSPKALSRIDIYRQTRNQLAQFKEAMQRT